MTDSETVLSADWEDVYQLCDAICALEVARAALAAAHCHEAGSGVRRALVEARCGLAARTLALGSDRPPYIRRALDRVARASRGGLACH